MLIAIAAGIITLAVIIFIIVFMVRRRAKHRELIAPSHDFKTVDTFGVEPEKTKTGFGTSGHTEVHESRTSTGTAGEALQGRFTAMTVLAAAIFGSLGVKLWTMQVLQAEDYERQAESNLYTTVYTPAPRGIIYDASGIALVSNRSSYTILATSDVADDHDTVQRLSALLGIPYQVVRQRILDSTSGAQSNRVVASDATLRNVAFISEHADAFPNVTTEMRTARTYPYNALAAHVLGYTGTASSSDLENQAAGRDIQSGDVVGKSGVESYYDDLLAGDHGTRTMLTDASGNVQEVTSETQPTRGNDIYLTIRGAVQSVADAQLRTIVAPSGTIGGGLGTAASLVCLDCTNGEVVALANFPTYSPESFIGGISSDTWNELNADESYYPLMNRAIQGTYPSASTMKAFSSMAALNCGIADSTTTWNCTGTWTGFGESYAQKCWLTTGHGTLDLIGGIAHSCDTVFYEIAKDFYEQSDTLGETALQDQIKAYGLGSKTGIDLSGEAEGRIPTPEWKAEYFKDAPEEAVWQGGDMTNMSIGQGYVLVTPIQLACAYGGIATGTVYRPHVLREVRNSLGETVISEQTEVLYTPSQDEDNIALVREGLKQVMTVNGYTSRYFSGDFEVAGKTGTAQVSGKRDYSWFCAYAPADDPKFVCACVNEQGQSGSSTMPAVAAVLEAAIASEQGSLDASSIESISSEYTVNESSSSASSNYSRED